MPTEQETITGFLAKPAAEVAKKLYAYSGDKAHKMIAAYVKKASAQQVTDTLNAYVAHSRRRDNLRAQQDKQQILENALSGAYDREVFPRDLTPARNITAAKAVLAAWRAPDVERAEGEVQAMRAERAAIIGGPAAAGAGPAAAALLAAQGAAAAAQEAEDIRQDEELAAQEAANTSEAEMRAALGPTGTQGTQSSDVPLAEEGDPTDGGRRRRKTRKTKSKPRKTKKRSAVRRKSIRH